MLSCCRVQTPFRFAASKSSSSSAANATGIPISVFIWAPNKRNSVAISCTPEAVSGGCNRSAASSGCRRSSGVPNLTGVGSFLSPLRPFRGYWILLLARHYSIPTIRSLRKMATSLDCLRKTMAEEVPGTLTALKLSSLEINELTQQLNSLRRRISASKHANDRPNKPTRNGKRPRAEGLE